MHIRRLYWATALALCLGILVQAPLPAASKSKKEMEAEIARLQEENADLHRQVDELVTKMELLMSRIDQLEKSVSGGPGSAEPSENQIEETEIVIEARGSEVIRKGPTPNLPVVKVEPQKPPSDKTKKVITITDDTKNPNNPKINIETVPAGKSGKTGAKPVAEGEKEEAELKPASLDEIKKLIASKQCAEAETRIKSRLGQKPGAKEACPLQFHLGEALSLCSRPAEAATAYLKVGDKYPACELAPEAMFKAGELLEKSDKNQSRKVFEDIVLLYPYSNYANLAEEKLKK